MTQASLPKRLWLPCPADQLDAELDRLCAGLRRRAIPYGYLSPRAPLLANLTVMENLWLPQAWLGGRSRRAVLLQVRELLDGVETGDWGSMVSENLEAWLGQRPSQLSARDQEQVAVLRAALRRPRVVVLDPGWTDLGTRMGLLAGASWWRPAPDPDPLMQQLGWTNMPTEAAYRLLM